MTMHFKAFLCSLFLLVAGCCTAQEYDSDYIPDDIADNDVFAMYAPKNFRLENFIYFPYGFFKPNNYKLSQNQMENYFLTFYPQFPYTVEKGDEGTKLRIKNLKAWNGSEISLIVTYDNQGVNTEFAVFFDKPFFSVESLVSELVDRGYHDVTHKQSDYWHYIEVHRSDTLRLKKGVDKFVNYADNKNVYYPAEIGCYFYHCLSNACLIIKY